MLKKVRIIANPGSGKGTAPEYADKLQTILEDTYQSHVELRLTEKLGDATEWSTSSVSDGFDTVICLGGDGTVNETIQGIMQLNKDERPYFGFVPLGTVNDLGRVLGYDMNPESALEQYRHVQVKPLDVACVNEQQYFMNVLAIGSIPESVMDTDSNDKNKLGVFAYVKDAIHSIIKSSGYQLTIKIDNKITKKIKTDLVIIGLTNSVGGYERMFPDANYSDKQLHMMAVKGTRLRDIIKAMLGINPKQNAVNISCQQIFINATESDVPTNIDGDEGPTLPITIQVVPHAICVLAPAN